MTRTEPVGHVSALWRYPVKSMAGEALDACEVTERGLLGDRGYALVDEAAGVIGSAKNPRAWPDLMAYRAAFAEPPRRGGEPPPVRITLPDGRVVAGGDRAAEELSVALGRRVALSARPPERPVLQQFWPDLDGTAGAERVTDEAMPPGTFFDVAPVNLLLTTTLDRLARAYPEGRFAISRFRPNVVVAPEVAGGDDPEPRWVGRILAVGDVVRLRIDSRCGRCVMTTLAQPDLPRDTGILRTVVRANDGFAGLYASVVRPGVIRVGDPLWFDDAAEKGAASDPAGTQRPGSS
jgi:uncharacterized protein YcbX